jgi:hypothetical protein
MDCIGRRNDKRSVIIECKTTGDSIDAASEYWLRLNFNLQLFQYYVAATLNGWKISEVLYDVTRKPSIRPKQIIDLDEKGLKIVKDKDGNRVYDVKTVRTVVKSKSKKVKDGIVLSEVKTPRQSASESNGWTVSAHLETPDEFCDRLWKDTKARPEFYFRRREVAILDSDVRQFELQRAAYIKMILALRKNERGLEHPEDAHPRNVSTNTCRGCEYKSFCLMNVRVDINNPPQGFAIQPLNPELKDDYDTTENENNVTA